MKRIKSDPKVALELFLYFFKIGWFTFGGGYSIIAQMQKDYVQKKKQVTEEQLLDQTSVGRSLPGLMIANVSYLFGYSQGGVLAGIASICGIMLPPILILMVITTFYTAFRENVYVARALVGVRSAVVPIIAAAVIKLLKGAFDDGVFSYILCGAALVLGWLAGINIALLIVGAAVIGLVYSEVKHRGVH